MWVLIIAVVAVAVAIAAAVVAWMAMQRAGEATVSSGTAHELAVKASAQASDAVRITGDQRDATEANNAMARDANSLAAEALRLTRDEHERVQRREDESHEVNWGVTWDVRAPLKEPEHVIDRRMRITQYGPDDAEHVEVFFYVGTFRWLKREAGDMKCDAGLTLFPVDRSRIIEEQLSRPWQDSAGNRVSMKADSPSVIAALDGMAYRAFNLPTKIIIRWKSAAGVTHQQAFRFTALSQHQLGADVKHPLP